MRSKFGRPSILPVLSANRLPARELSCSLGAQHLAPSDALEQLQLHKGSQFDSEVVAAMHEVVLQR
jgi:hypothetical protein